MLREARSPVVEVMDIDGEPIDMAVGFSNVRAGREMGVYLVDGGRRRIGYVGGNLQARVGVAKGGREPGRDSGGRTEQKQPEAAARAHGGQRLDQVHARDRLANGATLTPGCPHDPGPVRQTERRIFEHPRELPILPRPHHEFGIHRRHQVGSTFVDELLDSSQRRAHAEAVDPDTEDPSFRQASCR